MGLAGPKIKQRIGLDPQNRNWKDDKSKFGMKMMEKMGWAEGKGLGANEDGTKSHVKVRMKENNLGVGADRRTVDNWLDNNSAFDALLKGLQTESETTHIHVEEEEKTVDTTGTTTTSTTTTTTSATATVAGGRRSHRSKFMRNKAVSGYDAAALSMILGVAPTAATSTPELPRPAALDVMTAVAEDPMLKVAQTNVHDYFAKKMAALGLAAPAASTVVPFAFPGVRTSQQTQQQQDEDEDDYDRPPSFGGLGLGSTQTTTTAAVEPALMSGSGFALGGLGLGGFIKRVDVSITETLLQAAEDKADVDADAVREDKDDEDQGPSVSGLSEKEEKRARKLERERRRAAKAERRQARAEASASTTSASSPIPTPAASPVTPPLAIDTPPEPTSEKSSKKKKRKAEHDAEGNMKEKKEKKQKKSKRS
ncbi:PIN2/TERF1-interacting telomerase inhibitor 1 [Thoreauomyces humboldtii]|nr:PIN2/TERF1-interacting telomerase inhibitor 1 [Thoreauomyces humboldtii]